MHIPDGFLDPKISTGLLGAAAGVLGYCLGKVMKAVTAVVPQGVLAAAGNVAGNIGMAGRRILTKIGEEKFRQMGLVAIWIFAAQMFNFPINAGTSGHVIGGVFAGVILGPFAGTVVIAAVLIVQSLFFADGGIMALGANIVNMAVLGTFVSYYAYAWLKSRMPETISIALAAWFSVILASGACALEIGMSGAIGLGSVMTSMMTMHALVGVAEAIITVLLIGFHRKSSSFHE